MRVRPLQIVIASCMALGAFGKRKGMTSVGSKIQDIGPTTTTDSVERQDHISNFLADHPNGASKLQRTAVLDHNVVTPAANMTVAEEKQGSTTLSPPKNKVKGAYLVELDPAGHSDLVRRGGEDIHDAFHEYLSKRAGPDGTGVKYDKRVDIKAEGVFFGASVQLAADIDHVSLSQIPGVISVSAVGEVHPAAFSSAKASAEAIKALTAGPLPEHVMIGVDKLQKEGITGKDVTIGIIDTGVDYTLSALNGGKKAGEACIGPECPIISGIDIVGDEYEDRFGGKPVPDKDVMPKCPTKKTLSIAAHGTHVTSTIIGNDPDRGFRGVATGAKVRMYKVMACQNGIGSDALLLALAAAMKDGVDLISMSIGGVGGWADAPGLAPWNAAGKKIPIVVSLGNAGGETGSFSTTDTGSADDLLAVGSVDSTHYIGVKAQAIGLEKAKDIVVYSTYAFVEEAGKPLDLPLVVLDTKYNAGSACRQFPESTNFQGKVVMVWRGQCRFTVKLKNLLENGAKYVLIANRPPPGSLFYVEPIEWDNGQMNVGTISYEDGLALADGAAKGSKVSVRFLDNNFTILENQDSGGTVSGFSSVGPTLDTFFKPNVVAPGGNIIGVEPAAVGGYSIISGTSFSAPIVAGCVALFKEARKDRKWTPAEIRDRIQSTTTQVLEDPHGFYGTATNPKMLSSAGRQGAGLIDIWRAVHATTSVTPTLISLNYTNHLAPTHTITITNDGKMPQEYTMQHQPHGALVAAIFYEDDGFLNWTQFPFNHADDAAKVTFEPATFKVEPGAKQQVKINFTKPADDFKTKPFQVYSGVILAKSKEDLGTVSVSYGGIMEDLSKRVVMDTTVNYWGPDEGTAVALVGNAQLPFTPSENVTFNLNQTDLQPSWYFRSLSPTSWVQVALVEPNITFPATYTWKAPESAPGPPGDQPGQHARRDLSAMAQRFEKRFKVPSMRSELDRRGASTTDPVQSGGKGKTTKASTEATESGPNPPPPRAETPKLFKDVKVIAIVQQYNNEGRHDNYHNPYDHEAISDIAVDQAGKRYVIKPGTYKILIRALKPLADPTLSESYDSYLSQEFVYAQDGQGQQGRDLGHNRDGDGDEGDPP
ncbi:PROPROTEIN CONVERTASE SUBTILISIN/KEXIN [Ceraceosorus bombacis]|uniref:PROPROTEIN CONVERTASE SUBTILISIN/KEXIN n=1 Tax=Ceraceosorus bombacis TaxID=401625 RepID=A0A0P1B8T4_9BASI|nr:PROPROTEIN CONVERTASE SUBTILISIN/KEXIN [Ceraceosorus bombacis]